MSHLLFWKLMNLQAKYQFAELHIVAHSMGGLVARSLIVDYGPLLPFIRSFVSQATPWGGDKMAEYGVSQSPAVIPSWIDMQPNSAFIGSLYRTRMPVGIDFYMFFGHQGSRNPFQSNNDGTIPLSSLLDPRSQSEAKMNFAFGEDHASILSSETVSVQYNAILSTISRPASGPPSGGYLDIGLAYDFPPDLSRPWPTLILRPADADRRPIAIYLQADADGSRLGPFPAGDYRVSVVANAAKADRSEVPVSIASDTTRGIKFVFAPDGMIAGYVARAQNLEDYSVGMPDGSYLPADEPIPIQSIVLLGPGTHRRLDSADGDGSAPADHLVAADSFYREGHFMFTGLPAGEYELVIEGQGYRPAVETYAVTPGRLHEFRTTRFIADSN